MRIYSNGEIIDVDCQIYDPFPTKKGLSFQIELKTKGGGKRLVPFDATSIQDAIDQAKELYPGCEILGFKSIDSQDLHTV